MKGLHEDNMFASVRDRLRAYQEAPSDELWQKIAARKDLRDREEVPGPMWPLWLESSSLGAIAVMFFIGMMLGTDGMRAVVTDQFGDRIKDQTTITGHQENQSASQGSLENPTIKVAGRTALNSGGSQQNLAASNNSQEILTNAIAASTFQPATALPGLQTTDSTLPPSDIRLQIPDSTLQTPEIKPGTPSSELQPATVTPPYKKPHSGFQLFFSLTPSLSFQKIIPAHDNLIVEGFEHRSPLSAKRFGFGIDAGFQRNINNILGYYGGISFYRQQQELTYQYFDRNADVSRVGDSWTFEIDRPQHTKTFNYNMTNIGLRSGILVTLKGEKLQHKFGAGLIYSHGLVKGIDSYNNSRSGYLSYQLFYRNEVKINERISWFLEPTFIYGFISKEKLEEPFELKPYRAGISGGILYRF